MVEEIWSDVAVENLAQSQAALGDPPRFQLLVHDDERRYINANCELDTNPLDLESSGRLGPLKRRLKAQAGGFVVKTLARYFAEEREFIAHLVRLQNKLTVHHDRLADEISRLHHAFSVETHRLSQQRAVLHRQLELRIEELEREVAQLRAQRATGEPT